MASDTADLQVTVEKPGGWARRLTITVPATRVEREKRSAASRLAQKVRLPGFRKGKIPDRVMHQRFGAAIEQETLERVMGEAYREALEREGLQPISQGAIDNVSYAAGQDLTFHVDFEVRPEIELARLGGFEVIRDTQPVTEDQVDQVVDRIRDEQAVWHPVEETPVAGDMASVEITPLDAPANVEPKPRRYQIVVGEGQALPAIEDAIRTLRSGTADEFTVELPEDADDPAKGTAPHRIRIELLEAKRPERPVADDDFARAVSGVETLDALRGIIRQDLEAEAAREAERGVRQQLVQQIAEANPFEVPASMVAHYLDRVLPARDGVPEDQRAQLHAAARPAAEHAIRRILIVERVAQLEGLHASQEDIDARVDELANRLGRDAADVRRQLQKNGQLQEIAEEITESRVFDYLISLSTVR